MKYDPRQQAFVDKDGNLFYKFASRFLSIDTFTQDPQLANKTYQTSEGVITLLSLPDREPPERLTSYSTLNQRNFHQDQKFNYFSTGNLDQFIENLPDKTKNNVKKLHSEIAKFLVIHPESIPQETQSADKKGFIINPITGKRQKATAKHLKQLLKVYDYDRRNNRLVPKETIDHVYNANTGNLIMRKSAEKLSADKGLLTENVLNTFKYYDLPNQTAIGHQVQSYNVDFDIPISVVELDTNTLTKMIEVYRKKFVQLNGECRHSLQIKFNMIGVDRTGFQFAYTKNLGSIIGFTNNEALDRFIRDGFNKLLNKYQDTPQDRRKVVGISVLLINLSDDCTTTGGGNIRKLFGRSDVHIKYQVNDVTVILNSKDSDQNDCLLKLLHYFIKDNCPESDYYQKKPFSTKIQQKLYAADRVDMQIPLNEPISVEFLPRFAKKYKIGIIYHDSQTMEVMDRFSFRGEPELHLTVIRGHYFKVLFDFEKYPWAKEYSLELMRGLTAVEDNQVKTDECDEDPFLDPSKPDKLYYQLNDWELHKSRKINLDLNCGYLRAEVDWENSSLIRYCLRYQNKVLYFPDNKSLMNWLNLKSRLKYIITFGGSKLDLFYLYQGILDDENFKLSPYNSCVLNNTVYRLAIDGGAKFSDLGLLIRNQPFEKIIKQVDPGYNSENKSVEYHLLCLEKIFRQFNSLFYLQFKKNLVDYCSTSGIAESIMKISIPRKLDIYNTYPDVYKSVISAKYGARTFPLVRRFKSEYCEAPLGKLLESKDYLRFVDVDSAYAYVMYNSSFPIGESTRFVHPYPAEMPGDEQLDPGLYLIRYRPPKNLRLPVLLRHRDHKIVSDLEDNVGWHTHVEINIAIRVGYRIELLESVHWDKWSDKIFGGYVEKIYGEKLNHDSHPLMRRLYKDILVSSFGKLIQKIGNYNDEVISDVAGIRKFLDTNHGQELIFNKNDTVTLAGKERVPDLGQLNYYRKNIRRPYHVGIFILSYFRAYTLEILMKLSPDLTELPFHYISTDAFVVTQKQYEILEREGLMFRRTGDIGDSLGKLKDNLCDSGGYIIRADFYGPNQLRYQYVTDSGEVISSVKSSGVKKEVQNWEMFDMDVVKYKQIHKNISFVDGGIDIRKDIRDAVKENRCWSGMELRGNEWYPYGYE